VEGIVRAVGLKPIPETQLVSAFHFSRFNTCTMPCHSDEVVYQPGQGGTGHYRHDIDFKLLNGDKRGDADRSAEIVNASGSRKQDLHSKTGWFTSESLDGYG